MLDFCFVRPDQDINATINGDLAVQDLAVCDELDCVGAQSHAVANAIGQVAQLVCKKCLPLFTCVAGDFAGN